MSSEPLSATLVSELADALASDTDGSGQRLNGVLSIFELLHELVLVTNPQGELLYANAAAERMTGYAAHELVGKTPALWGRQMDKEFYSTFWKTIAEEKRSYRGEVHNKRKDGSTYDAEIRVTPVLDSEGNVRFFVGVERDISEEKRLIRSKRRFISLASHNLKTPLASMRWYAEMLRDGDVGRLSKGQREYVEEVLDAIKRMIAMVQLWLNVSRMDLGLYTFHDETLDMREVTQTVLGDLQQRIEREGVTVHFTPGSSPCTIVADGEVIHTIVYSLILNAVKYNRQGGTVEVEVRELPAGQEYAGKSFADARVLFSVRDTGVGIPADEQSKVFQQFFRASNVGTAPTSGAGLGLFLSHELVAKLRGDIWFSSSLQGSHFMVALPINSAVGDTVVPTA